ncbi:MAG TPA: TerB family tellurite resistance protein [Polyangiales bacterium]|nr:TerB family tellurite resistance protein [Polyangiales bacterium]
MTSQRPGNRTQAATERLRSVLREQLSGADDAGIERAVSLCGLVASLARIDRNYADAERPHVRRAIALIPQLPEAGVEPVCSVLEAEMSALAMLDLRPYAQALQTHSELPLRRQLLDVLADLAAADDAFTLLESDSLRRAAAALGLTPEEFQAAEARHQSKRRRLS